MIQDQLVEYVSSQIKLGVSRDAIKSALVGVGWQAVDVEDTLKKVEGDKAQPAVMVAPSQPVVQKPLTSVQAVTSTPSNTPLSKPSSPFASFSPSDIVGGVKNVSSQPVRMGDVVSSSAQSSAKNFFDKNTASASVAESGTAGKMGKIISSASEYPPKKKGGKVMVTMETLIILGLAVLSVFLYIQNSALSAKVNGLGGESTTVTSQVADLTAKIQAFTASDANLTSQVASLKTENADLWANLSFLIVPSVSSTSSVSVATTTTQVTGVLSGSKSASYFVTTAYGVKVSVKNSNDAIVSAALTPLVGTSVQLLGTHLLGSANLTVASINGVSVIQNVSPVTPSATSSASLMPQNVSTTTAITTTSSVSSTPSVPNPVPSTTTSTTAR